MTLSPARPAVAILLPPAERDPVAAELHAGGFDPIPVDDARSLAALLDSRRTLAAGVVDAEGDLDDASDAWDLLHADGRAVPTLMVIDPSSMDLLDLSAPGHETDEYLTRPYSAESIRWRIEAMCIRSVAVDDGSGPVLQGDIDPADWGRRGQLVAVFNPKGGVGKTMVATNLSAMLVHRGHSVLLVDADTVTGHVTTSLGMEGAGTVADAWRDELEGGPVLSFFDMASAHPSGLRVLPLTASPIHTELLDPDRVSRAIAAARRSADFVVVDLHPSYSPLNRAVFDQADRILMPITPDLPAIRAAVKLREVVDELGMRNRLSLVVNRANSGVPTEDVEKAVGMPAFATIRSAGPIMVKAANEGRSLVDLAPRDGITADFAALADRVLGVDTTQPARTGFRLFGKAVPARA